MRGRRTRGQRSRPETPQEARERMMGARGQARNAPAPSSSSVSPEPSGEGRSGQPAVPGPQPVFEQTTAQKIIVNTFIYSGAAAFAAIALALAIAYIVERKLVAWTSLLAFLCMAPFVIPGIVLAIGFYAAYAPPPLALYGTATILVLAYTTRFLPIAYTSSAAAVRSINPEMEEAVRILGGGRLPAIRKVVAPLLKKSLAGAWILVFIPAARELSSAIFLVGPNTRVISVMLFDLSEEGNFEVLSALGLILLVVTLVIALVGFKIIGRDFMLRRS